MLRHLSVILASFMIYLAVYLATLHACSPTATISAEISETELNINEPFTFTDFTNGANSWLWEFGNDDFATQKTGTYAYDNEGRYRIRLTVNETMTDFFIVNVTEVPEKPQHDPPMIVAPFQAFQGELILFRTTHSPAITRWEFGETGMVDSRDNNPYYTYSEPGTYTVQLTSGEGTHPLSHQIEVISRFSKTDEPVDRLSLIEQSIRLRLQNIANGNAFNANYNFILSRYLCNNHHADVIVNENRTMDYYSYSQGLRIAGNSRAVRIGAVTVETEENRSQCISTIHITQHSQN